MSDISPSLKFVINLAKVQSLLSRRFDGSLGGLGFTEFVILYHLFTAPEEKMRRIDLAGKMGITASGITRLLLPMEKVGYVKRETNPNDARVSFVILAQGGKRRFQESVERAELITQEIIPDKQTQKILELSETLLILNGTIV